MDFRGFDVLGRLALFGIWAVPTLFLALILALIGVPRAWPVAVAVIGLFGGYVHANSL